MDVSEKAEELATLMAQQLRVRSGSLKDVAQRANRRLPRHLQREVDALLEAETIAAHPKFAHRVDAKRITKAERKLRDFLNKQNPKAERRAEFLDRLAAIVFVPFAILVALFFLLIQRGYFD